MSVQQFNPEPRTPRAWHAATIRTPTDQKPISPSPGNWKHPNFNDITRRQHRNTFSYENSQRVLWNSIVLLATFFFLNDMISRWFVSWFPIRIGYASNSPACYSILIIGRSFEVSLRPMYFVWAVRLVLIYNIAMAIWPCFSQDEIIDIPLNDSQRRLLGLPDETPGSDRSATPESTFVTPPKYRRSSGSQRTPSSARSTPQMPSSSPLSQSPSNPFSRSRGRSPFAPAESSPLSQSLTRSASSRERPGSRFGSPNSRFERSVSLGQGTPSPATRTKGGGGLNYRWMYEKGKALPRNDSPLL